MSIRRLYRGGKLQKEDISAVELAEHLNDAQDDCYAWIDLGVTETDELNDLAKVLNLHHLAVEDVMDDQERQKLFRFPHHRLMQVQYLVAPTAHVREGEAVHGRVKHSRVSAFVTESVVVTVHDENFPVDELSQHLDRNMALAEFGIDYLIWGLLDFVVDAARDVLVWLDDATEVLGTEAFTTKDFVAVQGQVFRLRRKVDRVRRGTLPLRDVVAAWYHQELAEQGVHRLEPYFQDVLDHATFAVEAADSLRELTDTRSETIVGLQGNAANDIMKQVTSWAAIIGVPAIIVGFFGENVNFPGYGTDWGTWLSLGLIVVACSLLYVQFRRSDWL